MTNWTEKDARDMAARKVWEGRKQTIHAEYVKADKLAEMEYDRTIAAIDADKAMSYMVADIKARAAYTAMRAQKEQNYSNYLKAAEAAWEVFQAELRVSARMYAESEKAGRAGQNGQNRTHQENRDNKGRYQTKAAKPAEAPKRAFWDNGRRDAQTFRNLCKQYHPDKGGDTRTFQEILAAFGR